MRKKIAKTLLVLSGIFAAFMGSAWSFFCNVVKVQKKVEPSVGKVELPKSKFQLPQLRINHPRHRFEKMYEEGKAWCRSQTMQDCYIKSGDGLILHAYFLPAKDPKRIVLLSHGYKGSGFGDFAYNARFLHEHNCNLLFIDQRCCGLSEGEYITFGAKEHRDVIRWTNYIAKRNKDHLPIYLFGKSMGATSVLMASGRRLPPQVRGLISDCGFSSMRGQMMDMAANWFHLHWTHLLMFRVDLLCRALAGFHMSQADTTNAMEINRLPVLFFHGAMDTFVDPKNSIRNYSLCQAPKELVIVPEARHLCCAYQQPELYRSKLLEFFAKYDV